MKYIEFSKLIDSFITSLEESDMYIKYKKLDKDISNDLNINSSAKLRDSLYEIYSSNRSNKEALVDAKKIQDEINSSDIVKKYYLYRKKIRDILSIINEGIYREVFND